MTWKSGEPKRRIAVLGAGFQGVCIALEIARRKRPVTLFDREAAPITQAGAKNEGKVHLGFVYANEPDRRTADAMIAGALSFDEPVRRWCGLETLEPLLSTPYVYGVLADTMVSVPEIEKHFAYIAERIAGRPYLGATLGAPYRRLDQREKARLFDDETTLAAFATEERAVMPERMAELLRGAVAAEPLIDLRAGCEVQAVSESGGAFTVSYSRDGVAERERFSDVVNCLWTDRVKIDATLGVKPAHRYFHRYKAGILVSLYPGAPQAPSATFILGSYGDAVNFGDDGLYLSWYPAGMIAVSRDIAPPDWRNLPDEATEARIIRETAAAAARLMPVLRGHEADLVANARVLGGTIVATGASDIDDPESRLHRRIDIGLSSVGRYHSLDPGKYAMVPYYALKTVDRLLGEP
jgi:glycine/D-amino acid oxidase-like deaminating enzyme